jgi:hypothetical protein
MSWDRDCPSSPLILKLILSHCLQWLVGEIAANILMAGAPALRTASLRPTEQGWTSPPAESHHWSGESLLYDISCLGSLLHCDANICPADWLRAPILDVVTVSAMAVELQEQLYSHEQL